MAKRRMFSPEVIGSDAFISLPFPAQALYFHLNLEGADDDGIIGAPIRITQSLGLTRKDLNDLIEARFLLAFPSGRVVVKHWLINNTIRRDRYAPSTFIEERALLRIKENRAYTLTGEGITIDEFISKQKEDK